MIAALLTLALASQTSVVAGPATISRERQQEQAIAVVDLNTATVEELAGLPGIGPKKAAAIVAHRQEHAYTRVTQLLEVRGIGKKTLERLKPHVRVAAVPPSTSPTPGPSPAER